MIKIANISKIEINGLWNNPKLNFEWNLNPDINILAGDNGTGKSTILDLTASMLTGSFENGLDQIVKQIKITFDNGKFISFDKIEDTIKNLELRAQKDKSIREFIQEVKKDKGKDFNKIKGLSFNRISFENLSIRPDQLDEIIGIDVISTFDQELKDKETIRKITGDEVRTELDFQIYQLQKRYLNYQIDLGKRALELSKAETTTELISEIDEKLSLFKLAINNLFSITNKKINDKSNNISFLQNGKEIEPYQLSSGEKQLLIVLLTSLVQDEKPFILIMDEPEISLHTDWQEQLIECIMKLNRNAQIIIATHSPFVISQGWSSKVFQIENIRKQK